jgi:hypothetical protein
VNAKPFDGCIGGKRFSRGRRRPDTWSLQTDPESCRTQLGAGSPFEFSAESVVHGGPGSAAWSSAPSNMPLQRTKPASIVRELRGSQQLRALVSYPPPDNGFAAERQIVGRTGDVNTTRVAPIPTLDRFEYNTGAVEPGAVKGQIGNA